MKSLTFALHRNTTTFRILPQLNPGDGSQDPADVDIDACETSSSHKKLVEVTLEAGTRASKGAATGKGWWLGVDGKTECEITYGIPIPVCIVLGRDQLQC